MADNETIADIIAAKRRLAAEMEKALGDQHTSVEMLKDDADRLESAHKRERGDCAKLREACANIAEYARSAMCHATDAHLLGYLNQIEGWSKAALSTAPRNCDIVPIEASGAADIFHRERPLHGYDYETHDWLLAPATEKEGGVE